MASDQDVVDRLNAALTGRYQIESEIGAGGMATVYLAHDLKHDRKVAVKVLKPELAAVVGTERFLAEIRTTANLSHPHILPLFDSGEADGFLFYVMPYVEGESLRKRLDRDVQISVEEAVNITGHVADALDSAHHHGVIHRDIKPANILFQEGEPIVSDFGIALAITAAGEGRLTETGLSLGTPYYMSPEQATGDREPTAASDVYSLGCVLYEMLTGDPPHTGSSAQAVLGKILLGEVTRPTKLRRTIPANVEGAILKALERLPADRFGSGAELNAALRDKSFRHGGVGVTAGAGRLWNPLSLGLATAMVVMIALVLVAWPHSEPRPVIRDPLTLPADSGVVPVNGPSLALSPDGKRLVYTGPGEEGGVALWVRELDQLKPRRLPGTEGAYQPFFSPGGEQVGFIAAGDLATLTLKVSSLTGGSPVELVAVRSRSGASWGTDGFIYFQGEGQGLARVPERGGQIEVVTEVADGELSHRWPQVLPKGKGVLFTVIRAGVNAYSNATVAVADLKTGDHRDLMPGGQALYAASGHLLVARPDQTLVAAPFDQDRLTAGEPVVLTGGVLFGSGGGIHDAADVALASNGTLVFVYGETSALSSELVWIDRSGLEEVIDPPWAGRFDDLDLSQDGQRLAIAILDETIRIWVKELPDGPLLPLTDGSGGVHYRPVWSWDGRTVAYRSNEGPAHMRQVRSDGSEVGVSEVLLDWGAGGVWSMSYTPDDQGIVFEYGGDPGNGGTLQGLYYADLAKGSVHKLLATGFRESYPVVSPDGRWLAYVSDFSGQDEVYVRPFPDVNGDLTPVSTSGGREPLWAHNGRELFYRDLKDGWLVSASYSADSTFTVDGRNRLFDASGYPAIGTCQQYDVDQDDQRFVFIRPTATSQALPLILVENCFEELKERVGRGW